MQMESSYVDCKKNKGRFPVRNALGFILASFVRLCYNMLRFNFRNTTRTGGNENGYALWKSG